MIKKGTRFGIGSKGNYAFYIYGGSYTGEWGNNNAPTREQLTDTGFMEVVLPVYDRATHKIVRPEQLTDNGVEITNVILPLTPEELAIQAAILDKQEIRELKQASPDALELLGSTDQEISANIEAAIVGNSAEIVLVLKEQLKRQDRISRDVLNVLKAMVT